MTRFLRQPRSLHGERRVRFGDFEALKLGTSEIDARDPYRIAVSLTWPRFLLALAGAELIINFLFALLYLARPGAIANARPGSLTDAFFFSVETLATVGYGEMYPGGLYGHLVSAAEIVTGVAFVAVVTGLIFARVSRPRPCFRYPDVLVVTRHCGSPTLMIRVASGRLGSLYDVEARLSLLVPQGVGEHDASGRIADLPLVRSTVPVLALSWTLMHVIDETSPLARLDGPAMVAAGLRLFLTLRADDATISTSVRDLRTFNPAQIRFGVRYADAISISDDGRPVLDLDRLGLIEPDPAGRREAAGAREPVA